MSAASCSRSTRGWGVPRAFLKLCGFFKSGAPSPPPPTGPPTTGRCTPSLVRVAFSPSRFLPAAFICVAIRPSLFISSYLAPLPSPSLSLHTLTLSPLSRHSSPPLLHASSSFSDTIACIGLPCQLRQPGYAASTHAPNTHATNSNFYPSEEISRLFPRYPPNRISRPRIETEAGNRPYFGGNILRRPVRYCRTCFARNRAIHDIFTSMNNLCSSCGDVATVGDRFTRPPLGFAPLLYHRLPNLIYRYVYIYIYIVRNGLELNSKTTEPFSFLFPEFSNFRTASWKAPLLSPDPSLPSVVIFREISLEKLRSP